jgi:hypothetical protein
MAGQGEGERQLAYWKAQLGDDHPVLELATDHPRSARQLHSAARHSVRLGVSLSDAIKQTAQAHQSTPFMLLLAAFQSLLHRYSGQRDIRIGVPNANRPRLETQGLIGFFINTQVLRAEVDSRLPFVELLAQTARPRWAPRPIRTCRSNNCSKRSRRPANRACSRSCSTTSNAT